MQTTKGTKTIRNDKHHGNEKVIDNIHIVKEQMEDAEVDE